MAQVLLDHDVKVNTRNYRGETALHVVSRSKHNLQEGLRVAQLLLERGGDVHMGNNDHWTSLHAASCHGRFDIAQVLLDHGAKANGEDKMFKTPLHLVSGGEFESQASGARVAQLLLEQGADVNASDKHLWTPLHYASQKGRPEIVQLLLDHGAKANANTDRGETPLLALSRSTCDPQDGIRVVQLLLDHGADVNARRKDHCTSLHGISYAGRLDIARVLLDHGAKANAEYNFLRTPLHTVSLGQHESEEDGVRVAQLLLECGVDVDARDKNRETPLHLASASGRLEIARVLLKGVKGATVKNDQGDQGRTPLHVDIEGEYLPPKITFVSPTFFLERGADVNARRKDHWTPLHLASYFGKPDVARVLLDHGAKANAVDNTQHPQDPIAHCSSRPISITRGWCPCCAVNAGTRCRRKPPRFKS